MTAPGSRHHTGPAPGRQISRGSLMYQHFGKRYLDIVGAAGFLVVFSWLYLLVAALVRVALGSPVLFTQVRPGRAERPFVLYKFRTMTQACDADGIPLPEDARITRVGRFLRKTSLDEIPEIWNILIGDMSFVGPRPLLMQYLPYYTDEERVRHTVRPGLTGLAQISGRNDLPWDSRLALDAAYARSIGFAEDMRILRQTVVTVVSREGIRVGAEHVMLNLDEERSGRGRSTP